MVFDQPLSVAVLDPTNWTARIGNWHRGFSNAAVFNAPPYTRLDCWNWYNLGVDAGPDVINYAPPPFDVVSSPGGVPAAAFSNFPLTVVP